MSPVRLAVILTAAYWTLAATATLTIAERWRPAQGLAVTAYATTTWQGAPIFRGLDATLSNELLGNPPFPQWQVYSLEWTGALAIAEAGTYTFSLSSDDGSTLEIDDGLVVDNGGEHLEHRVTGTVALTQGVHPVRLRYFQNAGHYTVSLLWAREGAAPRPIPAALLMPDAPSAAEYRWRTVAPLVAGATMLALFAAGYAVLRRGVGGVAVSAAGRRLGWLLTALERPPMAIATLLVVGGAARFALFATTPPVLWPDSHVFDITARQILDGWWGSHDAYRTAAYPYFLAAFLAWGQTPAIGALILVTQLELGLLTAVILYLVARRAFTPLVAFGGALLFAVHPLELFYEMAVLTETLFTLTLMATLWCALRAYERPSWGRAATLGLMAAALVLVRPVAQWLIYPVLATGALSVSGWRVRVRSAAVAAVCYAVPLMLWMAVNQHEYGFFGVALGRGMGLYTRVFEIDGLEPPAPSFDPGLRHLWSVARVQRWSPNRVRDELNYVQRMSGARSDERMFAFTMETVRAHPVAYAIGTLRQWLIQVARPLSGVRTCQSGGVRVLCSGRSDGDLPAFSSAPFPANPSLRRAVVQYVSEPVLAMTAIAALALIGVLASLWARPRHAASVLLAVVVAYITLVPALSQYEQDRFRLPIDGLLFLFALWGARAMARRWPPLALATDVRA